MRSSLRPVLSLSCLLVTLSSCQGPAKSIVATSKSFSGSLLVTVTGLNLSERMSGDDEILLLCYSYPDSISLGKPLFYRKLKVDAGSLSQQFDCAVQVSAINNRMLLVLLEQDDETPVPVIDSILRVSHQAIAKEVSARNYMGIEKYLGDEDVLGIKAIPGIDCGKENLFNFSGIYKADKYEYQLRLECN
jgi:hypothetical protein